MASDEKYFRASAFEDFARHEDGSWWFRSRNILIVWALRKWAGRVQTYLEIGCGTGFVLRAVQQTFPQAHITGSEYFAEGLAYARDRVPSATFIKLDATLMDETDAYDLVGAFDVLEHIEQDEVVLDNLAAAVRPGGTLAVTVPQHRWMWSPADEYACHVRRYTRRELIHKVEAAGFEIECVTSFVALLFPLMVAARGLRRRGDFDPMAEFTIAPWQSSACETLMAVERWLIRCGVRFPFGGSILLLARKPELNLVKI
jgi:SAM-dependent methyltransferase